MVNQKINAVLKGSIEAGIEVAADYLPTPYGLIVKNVVNSQKASDKLDRQHENDKTFLKKISDYHNYFNVVMETGSSVKGINFAVGPESINGGDITFHLGESGISTLSLETVDSDGKPVLLMSPPIDTNGVEDIVMGIGESETIMFTKKEAKLFYLISYTVTQKELSLVSHDNGKVYMELTMAILKATSLWLSKSSHPLQTWDIH